MSLKSAFNLVLKIRARQVTVKRLGTPDITAIVPAAQGNYFRNLAAPANVVIEGREFVISKDSLDAAGFPTPLKRNDRIVDAAIGTLTISDVHEMSDVGGGILGYRVRTS